MVVANAPQKIEVLPLSDQHTAALADFYGKVWSKSQTSVDEIRNNLQTEADNNPVYPGQCPPAYVFLKDEVMIGYIGTIPTRFWNGEQELPGHWMKGFMVLEEHRDGPVGFYVLKEAAKHIDLAGVLTVAPASRKLFEAVGFKNLGKLYNHLALTNPAKVLSQINPNALGMESLPTILIKTLTLFQKVGLASVAGYCLGLMLAVWRKINCFSKKPYTICFIESFEKINDLDSLWEQVRSTTQSISVRDASYLPWRYEAKDKSYRYVLLSEGNKLHGIAILRMPKENTDARLSGLKVASLSDLIFSQDNKKAGLILLNEAQKYAKQIGADALLCSISHKSLPPLLTQAGYFPLPTNVHFLLRQKPEHKLSNNLGDWWLTRGDARSDETF